MGCHEIDSKDERLKQKKRVFNELPYTEMVKSGTARLMDIS